MGKRLRAAYGNAPIQITVDGVPQAQKGMLLMNVRSDSVNLTSMNPTSVDTLLAPMSASTKPALMRIELPPKRLRAYPAAAATSPH